MPVISMFYGIIIRMYFMDNQQHSEPHIHALYSGAEAVFPPNSFGWYKRGSSFEGTS